MGLNAEQWKAVSQSLETLRGLGCAVCVFTPDDVESAYENAADEGEAGDDAVIPDGAVWLGENRKMLEDGMSTWGNQAISDNIPN